MTLPDKKEVKEAIVIVKANRNSVTWDLESSKAYRDATEVLISIAAAYRDGELVKAGYEKGKDNHKEEGA